MLKPFYHDLAGSRDRIPDAERALISMLSPEATTDVARSYSFDLVTHWDKAGSCKLVLQALWPYLTDPKSQLYEQAIEWAANLADKKLLLATGLEWMALSPNGTNPLSVLGVLRICGFGTLKPKVWGPAKDGSITWQECLEVAGVVKWRAMPTNKSLITACRRLLTAFPDESRYRLACRLMKSESIGKMPYLRQAILEELVYGERGVETAPAINEISLRFDIFECEIAGQLLNPHGNLQDWESADMEAMPQFLWLKLVAEETAKHATPEMAKAVMAVASNHPWIWFALADFSRKYGKAPEFAELATTVYQGRLFGTWPFRDHGALGTELYKQFKPTRVLFEKLLAEIEGSAVVRLIRSVHAADEKNLQGMNIWNRLPHLCKLVLPLIAKEPEMFRELIEWMPPNGFNGQPRLLLAFLRAVPFGEAEKHLLEQSIKCFDYRYGEFMEESRALTTEFIVPQGIRFDPGFVSSNVEELISMGYILSPAEVDSDEKVEQFLEHCHRLPVVFDDDVWCEALLTGRFGLPLIVNRITLTAINRSKGTEEWLKARLLPYLDSEKNPNYLELSRAIIREAWDSKQKGRVSYYNELLRSILGSEDLGRLAGEAEWQLIREAINEQSRYMLNCHGEMVREFFGEEEELNLFFRTNMLESDGKDNRPFYPSHYRRIFDTEVKIARLADWLLTVQRQTTNPLIWLAWVAEYGLINKRHFRSRVEEYLDQEGKVSKQACQMLTGASKSD